MPRRPPDLPVESLADRRQREAQTARNLAALEAEQEGRLHEATALYERNVAEGFAGDFPYGRLVAIYERQGAYDDAERVLERAIQVFETTSLRTPADRRSLRAVFRRRLAAVRKARRQAERSARGPGRPSAPESR